METKIVTLYYGIHLLQTIVYSVRNSQESLQGDKHQRYLFGVLERLY